MRGAGNDGQSRQSGDGEGEGGRGNRTTRATSTTTLTTLPFFFAAPFFAFDGESFASVFAAFDARDAGASAERLVPTTSHSQLDHPPLHTLHPTHQPSLYRAGGSREVRWSWSWGRGSSKLMMHEREEQGDKTSLSSTLR